MPKIMIIDDEIFINKILKDVLNVDTNIIEVDNEVSVLNCNNIKIDLESYEVFNDNESITLTAKEFEILKLLMKKPNKVISREYLLNEAWGYDYYGDPKIVNTHIKNIRKKLKTNIIKTVRGVGYKIERKI